MDVRLRLCYNPENTRLRKCPLVLFLRCRLSMDTYVDYMSTSLMLSGMRTYVSQYRMEPSLILSRPASSNAFSSAWMHRHVERLTPALCPALQRGPMGIRTANATTSLKILLTASVVTILQIPRRTIITRTNHPFLPD